jgi:transcriptional antiterminator NusG
MALKWYAIQTYAMSELSVKRAIEQMVKDYHWGERVAEILVPTEDVIEIKNGKQKITARSLYPAYVFAQLDLDTDMWHKIQSLPKVGGFIGEQKTPTPLTEKDIKVILDKAHKKNAPRPKVSFENSEVVRITEGPFANFTGIVEEYDMAAGVLKLNVSIFGRSTPVEIEYSQVEKII